MIPSVLQLLSLAVSLSPMSAGQVLLLEKHRDIGNFGLQSKNVDDPDPLPTSTPLATIQRAISSYTAIISMNPLENPPSSVLAVSQTPSDLSSSTDMK